jgi:hypothetical protein
MVVRDAPNFDDANLALKLYELRREPEMRKARSMIGEKVAGRPWEEVERLFSWEHPENAHLRQATSYWEIVAAFVNRGILHPDMYLDACGEGIFTYWCFRPHLERIRAFPPRARFLLQTERVVAENPAIRERLDLIERNMSAHAAAEKPAAKRKPARRPAKASSRR